MEGFTYLLLSEKDQRTYLGSTNNLTRRLEEHRKGLCKSTRNRRPLKLIHSESFKTLGEARKRERYLKSRKGREELKNIFKRF